MGFCNVIHVYSFTVSYDYHLGLPWTVDIVLQQIFLRDPELYYPFCQSAKQSNIIERPEEEFVGGEFLLKLHVDEELDLRELNLRL